MMETFIDRAPVSNEEVPLDPQGRLARVKQRVKDEYRFNQSDFHIDESSFERVTDPNANEKLLYESLCNSKLVDGTLENIDMTLYGADGYQSVFLRSCYFDFFELILDSLVMTHSNEYRLILGSPGIGKSWFHVFCLYVLIKANAPVCLQRNEHFVLFYEGEVYLAKGKLKDWVFGDSNIWFLYDRNEAPIGISHENIKIFVSSILNRRAYKECSYHSSLKLFMPLWNYKELMHANRVRSVERRLTEKHLLEAYLLCGGVAQNIFDNFVDYRMNYHLLLDNIPMSDLKHGKLKELNCQIIGLRVWERYFTFDQEFLSKSIGRDVFQRLSDKAGITMQQTLNSNECAYYLKSIAFACEGLKEFGVPKKEFLLQSLDDKKFDMVISFPDGLSTAEFLGLTLDNVVWDPSIPAKLWIPQFSTFPCIDGLLLLPSQKLALGLKFTTCSKEPIVRELLGELTEHCESKFEGSRFAMVFVVRKRDYDSFGRQGQSSFGKRRYSGIDELFCEPSEEVPCPQYKLKMF